MMPAKALQVVLESAANGDPFAQTMLAYLMENRIILEDDGGRVLKLYKEAAVQGFVPAKYHLSRVIREQSPDEALKWLNEAAEENYHPAQAQLASDYWSGEYLEADRDKAFYWMKRAADGRYVPAMLGIALLYEEKSDDPADRDAALEYLRLAHKQGHPKATHMMSDRLLESKDQSKIAAGLKLVREAAKKGEPFALLSLAQIYAHGLYGVQKESEIAELLRCWSEEQLSAEFSFNGLKGV